MANLWGTVVATIFLTFLPEFLRAFQEVDVLAYGFIIIVIMIFMPKGLFAGIADLFKLIRAKLRRKESAPA